MEVESKAISMASINRLDGSYLRLSAGGEKGIVFATSSSEQRREFVVRFAAMSTKALHPF